MGGPIKWDLPGPKKWDWTIRFEFIHPFQSKSRVYRFGHEAGGDVPVDVEQVERGGVLLEVDRVHGVAAVRVRAGDRFVRDGRARGGGQRAVDLLQGADQVVGHGGVLRRLRRADDEAARRACARWQGGGCGQRVCRGVHSSESGARQQREC